MNNELSNKKWFTEPLMWLVLGLPAVVVVAGISTWIIAASNPESLVREPHTKTGFTVKAIASQEGQTPKQPVLQEPVSRN